MQAEAAAHDHQAEKKGRKKTGRSSIEDVEGVGIAMVHKISGIDPSLLRIRPAACMQLQENLRNVNVVKVLLLN